VFPWGSSPGGELCSTPWCHGHLSPSENSGGGGGGEEPASHRLNLALSLHLAEEDPVHSSLFSDISSQFRSNLDPSLLWEIERIVPRVVGVLG
jgi:hypothetical protein